MKKKALLIGTSFAGQEQIKGWREDCSYQLTIDFIFKDNLSVDIGNLHFPANEVTL